MKAFRASGKFLMGREWTTFSTEVAAADDQAARDRILSTLGSRHRVDRRHITIDKLEAVATADVKDPIVRKSLGG